MKRDPNLNNLINVAQHLEDLREQVVFVGGCAVGLLMKAFRGRGQNDFILSADIEDIISVIDGRKELLAEIKSSAQDLQKYIAQELQSFLETPTFLQNLSGFVPGDPANQARVPLLLNRIKELSSL